MAEPVPLVGDVVEATPIEAIPEPMPFAEASPVHPEAVPLAPVVEAAPTPPPAVEAPPPPAPAPSPVAPATGGDLHVLPSGAQPRLVVQRGLKRNVEYPLYEGQNFIGRADEKPVDIDLEDQEPPDRIWSSRQHAVIMFENNTLTLEDLNSSNGTFLNREKIYPAQPKPLKPNDVIQIGTVQMKLLV